MTSPALVETDLGLCPGASTETLVGELFRRLGHALLDLKLADQIASGADDGLEHMPRFYALGSVTPGEHCSLFGTTGGILDRQRRLVSGSFGDLLGDDPPLVIAASVDNSPFSEGSAILNTLCSTNRMSLIVVNSNTNRVDTSDDPGTGTLDLLTLWPFILDE